MVNTRQLVDKPVVERAVVFEFQCANRMGDAFDRILQPVSPVVHRIDAPFCTRFRMFGMKNPIHNRISHVQVGRGHVDFCPQNLGSVGEFSLFHPAEQIQILFDGTVAVRAFRSRLGQRSPHAADFVDG